LNNLKVAHVAVVVKDIRKYLENSLFGTDYKIKYYEIRDSEICFIKLDNIELEIIEPKSEKATTYNFLQKKGEGVHHICYEIENLDEANNLIQKKKMLKLADPAPAPEIGGRHVMFAYGRNNEIIEFLLKN